MKYKIFLFKYLSWFHEAFVDFLRPANLHRWLFTAGCSSEFPAFIAGRSSTVGSAASAAHRQKITPSEPSVGDTLVRCRPLSESPSKFSFQLLRQLSVIAGAVVASTVFLIITS
ncbi:hypothetical protein U1Q18_004192 [Sarracenia purpurea var. burkii]